MTSRTDAAVLRSNRQQIVQALISGQPGGRQNRFEEPLEVFHKRVGESVDLLSGHLDGRPNYGSLYVGQRIFELHDVKLDRNAALEASRLSVEHDRKILGEFLSPQFVTAYDAMTEPLSSAARRHVRTLFIGDCLMMEIMSFLVGPLLKEGVSIDAFPLNSHGAVQFAKMIGELNPGNYQAVFFSPFSHATLPELEALTNPRRAIANAREARDLAQSVIDQTGPLLDLLSQRFECPIFVHSASVTPRAGNALKAIASQALLAPSRAVARTQINNWLTDYIQKKNASTYRHLHLIDETKVALDLGLNAGRLLYESPFQHATVLSQALADEYQTRIGSIAHLVGRKLVVCDLDNTLWDGVIGEGAVTHFLDRQKVLDKLRRDGGIVLSIASKNEPANVHFRGGLLTEDDFVSPQISWNPKAKAIQSIAKGLNLQTRHMVFLDDRPDERAMVLEAHPEILVLDPCDPDTWKRLGLWAELIEGSSDLDRTALYKEQLARDSAAAGDQAETGVADTQALASLKLKFTVGAAKKSDLKRVAELINRTNQWNMCGSRTTFQQVQAWHDDANAAILIGSATDKFGDMGTVCVAVVTSSGARADIPVFVLSCRVFGYGVETAVLAEINRRASALGATELFGKYVETAQNHPGRAMYPDHGFTPTGNGFSWPCARPIPDVEWAEIVLK